MKKNNYAITFEIVSTDSRNEENHRIGGLNFYSAVSHFEGAIKAGHKNVQLVEEHN